MPNYEQMALALRQAKKITILTGAGMSTASGLSDYRSHGGLWDGRDPFEISHATQVGTPHFREFFTNRILDVRSCRPNAGHILINQWRDKLPISVVTQNIDSYHGKDTNELHGHLRYLQCTMCGTEHSVERFTVDHDDKCPDCGQIIRPLVVLFGEELNVHKLTEAMGEVLTSDVVLILGTSLEVAPFNELVEIAFSNRAQTILITQSDTPYDGKFSFRSYEKINEALQAIDSYL